MKNIKDLTKEVLKMCENNQLNAIDLEEMLEKIIKTKKIPK